MQKKKKKTQMSIEGSCSLAFQIFLFLYIMLFLLLNYFTSDKNTTFMKNYYIATFIIVPLLSLVAIGLTASIA